MSVSNTANARLCHVIKCADFDGYGFNLHAEKGKPGQFIGKVDEGSPAETAGLRMGDRILEVNGVSILDENHKQVVQRIKAIPDETKLLVVDPKAEVTPKDTTDDPIKPSSDVDTNSTASSLESSSPTPASTPVSSKLVSVEPVKIPSPTPTPKPVTANNNNTTNNTEKRATSPEKDSSDKVNGKKLNLPMTAKEFRAQLAAKKKLDPKNQSIDIKSKYDIVQKL